MMKNSVALSWKGLGDLSAADLDPTVQSMTWLSCFQIGARYVPLPDLAIPD